MAPVSLTINRTSWITFRDTMRELTPFKTCGNLSGHTGVAPLTTGKLPDPYASLYWDRRDSIDYTVYSYSTPIAWHDTELGWVMPPVKYSVTTSKAQGRIAPAVAALNEEAKSA